MIVVSLNPAVDVEWQVDHTYWEEKNSILAERRWAGGKGVNVARWLKYLGVNARLIVPLGGPNGRELARALRTDGLPFNAIPLAEETRANVVITEPAGEQLRFNRPGPKLSASHWAQVRLKVDRMCRRTRGLLILGGALPRGLPGNAYAQLIRIGNKAGMKCLLDCDGPALKEGVQAKPFLVKPNEDELRRWAMTTVSRKRTVEQQALAMSRKTGGWVMVSRGGRGAILVNEREKVMLSEPVKKVDAVNTLGAGDALLAGAAYAIDQGLEPAQWLKWGVKLGTAATRVRAGMTNG